MSKTFKTMDCTVFESPLPKRKEADASPKFSQSEEKKT